MPPTAQATIEQLKAALLEHPFGSALQAAVWDAMEGGVPFPEIDEILDAKERKMLAAGEPLREIEGRFDRKENEPRDG